MVKALLLRVLRYVLGEKSLVDLRERSRDLSTFFFLFMMSFDLGCPSLQRHNQVQAMRWDEDNAINEWLSGQLNGWIDE